MHGVLGWFTLILNYYRVKKKCFLRFHSGGNAWLEFKDHQTITNSRLCISIDLKGKWPYRKERDWYSKPLMLSRDKSKYNISLDTSSWGRPHVWERPLETGKLGQVSYVHHTTLPVQLQIKDSVQNTHPSQECDLKNAPPCPYKWNSSQKEISTVNVMCFTACLSMAQWVDIIAFSKVEKQEGCEGTCCCISAPLHLWQHRTINTHIPPTFFLQKTHAGELRGCGDCFCWLLYLCCWYKESETERLCFKSAALLST